MMKSFLFIIIGFALVVSLSACGTKVADDSNTVEQKDVESADIEVNDSVDKVNKVNKNESAVFFLSIDEETFEIETPLQEEFSAYDILSLYAAKQGVELKTKGYSFGMFIEGIGEKIGDADNFWLFYVNDKLANSSADTTIVQPGDVIKFEFTSNNPF
ncbi:DUF4430 domain-containing protein [Patescibacteria group bacterium]|nr:DUF4430 domain-containing protein [Patescibacteria group bacterium]MBU4512503.1 DUF4430 domain-containing protein [Patescibacteria group bacterium]MCG2693518.1 DUF4430 domain-containing protein [Candidatus Parcubacteria bacterium]